MTGKRSRRPTAFAGGKPSAVVPAALAGHGDHDGYSDRATGWETVICWSARLAVDPAAAAWIGPGVGGLPPPAL